MSEVNTALLSGHFLNDGIVQPSIDFWRAFKIEYLEDTIGFELGYNRRHNSTSRIPIYIPCENIIVKQHGGMWGPSKKKEKSETKI